MQKCFFWIYLCLICGYNQYALSQPLIQEDVKNIIIGTDAFIKFADSDTLEYTKDYNADSHYSSSKLLLRGDELYSIVIYSEGEESQSSESYYFQKDKLIYYAESSTSFLPDYAEYSNSQKQYFQNGSLVRFIYDNSEKDLTKKKRKEKKVKRDIDIFSKEFRSNEFDSLRKETLEKANNLLKAYTTIKNFKGLDKSISLWNMKDTSALIKNIDIYASQINESIAKECFFTFLNDDVSTHFLFDNSEITWVNNNVTIFAFKTDDRNHRIYFDGNGNVILWNIEQKMTINENSYNINSNNKTSAEKTTRNVRYYFFGNSLIKDYDSDGPNQNPYKSLEVNNDLQPILKQLRTILANRE